MTLDHLPPVPSVKEYKRAFSEIKDSITPKQMQLLQGLYTSPNHAATANKLAAHVGYDGFRGTNLQIGKIGSLLRETLNYHGEGQKSYVLCYFRRPQTSADEWILIMHEEVATALKELAWFA